MNQKLRIGMFTEVYKPCLNGVVYSLEASKKGLENIGSEVSVYAPQYGGYSDKEKKIYRCSFIPLRAKYYGIGFPSTFSREAKQTASGLEVIHVHHPGFGGITKYGAGIAKKRNIPLVLTSHTQYMEYSHYVPFYQPFVKEQIRKTVERFGNKCDCIISPSAKIKEMLSSRYEIKTRIEIVPNSIDTELFKRRNSEQLKKKLRLKNKPVLIFSGRLEKEKNIDFLIRSFAEIRKAGNYAKLLIVGDGSERDALQMLAKQFGLENEIIFTGKIPHNEMPFYYSCADMFITASKTEVHPLTVLEAMSVGLVPLGLNAPGVGDIIADNKNGILVGDENEKSFADAVINVLENPTRFGVLSRNAKTASEQYSIDRLAGKLYKLYLELIQEKR